MKRVMILLAALLFGGVLALAGPGKANAAPLTSSALFGAGAVAGQDGVVKVHGWHCRYRAGHRHRRACRRSWRHRRHGWRHHRRHRRHGWRRHHRRHGHHGRRRHRH